MTYEVNINAVRNPEGSLRGFASVVFEDCFKISNIAIIENKDGELFVSMPRYVSGNEQGEYKDICNPITKEFRENLYNAILGAFQDHLEKGIKKIRVGAVNTKKLEFNVRVTPFEKEGSNIRGLARIYLEDCFVINNVTLLQGKNGVFVAMPSYKTKQMDAQGKAVYQDVCFPVTKEFRERLYGEVKHIYEQVLEKQQKEERGEGVRDVSEEWLEKDGTVR